MQRLRAWKLQQQHEQEEQQRRRQEEEEERKKREEEIRKIRDLSNQDEQYNRFMKLVGSKHHPRSKVRGHTGFCHCIFVSFFFLGPSEGQYIFFKSILKSGS